MKYIFEYIFTAPRKTTPPKKLDGILVAICDESNFGRTTNIAPGAKLLDVYPHYILFDWSTDEEPRLHKGFTGNNLIDAMWTVGEHAIHDTFEEMAKAVKDMWPAIKRSSDLVVSLDDVFKPTSEDARKAVIELFE